MQTDHRGVPESSWAFPFRPPEMWQQLGRDDHPHVRWVATAINESGHVVGGRRDRDGRIVPLLWRDGEVEFLDTGEYQKGSAMGITRRSSRTPAYPGVPIKRIDVIGIQARY